MDKEAVLTEIEKSLEKIRPFLKKDGGDVKVVDFTEEGLLQLEFLGNCGTCSMSGMTFKNGIEENVKNDVSAVNSIEVINLIEDLDLK